MKKQFKKSRRWIVFISIVLAFAVYVNLQNNWIEVEHMDVKIDNLPKELEELKIAHISDVHIPKNVSSIENLVSKLQKENPDLIVITGDIIDESADIDDPQLSELCRSLANIADTYAVTGNHEVWNNNIEKWKTILYENNVKVVEHIIEIYYKGNAKLAIMGLKDNRSYSYEYFSGIETVKDTPKILLAHRPDQYLRCSVNCWVVLLFLKNAPVQTTAYCILQSFFPVFPENASLFLSFCPFKCFS
jgi:predicted MPP superfamily phosphohydrolase